MHINSTCNTVVTENNVLFIIIYTRFTNSNKNINHKWLHSIYCKGYVQILCSYHGSIFCGCVNPPSKRISLSPLNALHPQAGWYFWKICIGKKFNNFGKIDQHCTLSSQSFCNQKLESTIQ